MISVGEAIPGQRSVCGGKPGPVVLGLLGCLGSFVASSGLAEEARTRGFASLSFGRFAFS